MHHRFRVRDDAGSLELSMHLEVHVIELERWRSHRDTSVSSALLGWLRFFTEAEGWSEVPAEIENPVLESAMAVLTDYQKNAALNDLYRARLDFIRTQNTMLADRDDAIAERDAERAAKEAAVAEKDAAVAEKDAAVVEKDAERAAREAAVAEKDAAVAAAAQMAAELAAFRARSRRPGSEWVCAALGGRARGERPTRAGDNHGLAHGRRVRSPQ